MKSFITASALTASLALAESMYNPVKSEVSIYNTVNFPKQVTNNREKGISIVQFYESGGKPPLSCRNTTVHRAILTEGQGLVREIRY
jgi:hypothetical protein